jgi:glycosyltransferase involved in cell wall biosynthesis
MRIVVAHNFYQQAGGEDQCVAAEIAVLQRYGHEVTQYCLYNDQIDHMRQAALAARTIWNPSSYGALRRLLRDTRPDIVHFHNTFPLMSPAVYYAARAEGAGVVQTLHNFRLTCANALLLRNGSVCEDCLGKFAPWAAIRRKCYRDSRAASTAITAMLATHRLLGTWQNAVDVYVALTEFGRRKFLAAGLPADRIVVKPNFVERDSGPGEGEGGYGAFVGRLSAEKGVQTLLDAWRHLDGQVPLRIIGDGPLAPLVRAEAARDPSIQWLGSQPLDAVYRLIGDAAFVVLPSRCFEGFPRVISEAFAKGTPVIASRMGAMAELVDEGHTGLLFAPGDGVDLARAIRRLLADPSGLLRMRESARAEFTRRFTAELNHQALMRVYEQALGMRTRAGSCH